MTPALAGRFFNIEPTGKLPSNSFLMVIAASKDGIVLTAWENIMQQLKMCRFRPSEFSLHPLLASVIYSKFHHFSEPPFPYLSSGDHKTYISKFS